jgi:hypothetical protein
LGAAGEQGEEKSAAGPGTLNRIMAGDDAESRVGNTVFQPQVLLEIRHIGRETGLFLRNAF